MLDRIGKNREKTRVPRTIEPFYLALGRRISDARRRSGLTQEALGSRVQPAVTRAAIANIETGKQRVLAKMLVDIAQALGVAPGSLLPDPEQEPAVAGLEPELAAVLDLPEEAAKVLAVKIAGRRSR